MMKNVLLVLLITFCLSGKLFAHPSFLRHYEDIGSIFNGYANDKAFEELSKGISTGIDSDLPQLFRAKFGKIPGNHRILGHGWTLNGSIPERILVELEKTYSGRRGEIIELWREFAKGLTLRAEQLTGLPPQQAKALATMINDIHLLGDLEPGNKLVEYVLSPREIVNDFNKNAEIIFKNKPQYAEYIKSNLSKVLKSSSTLEQKYVAQNIMDTLYKIPIGTMIKDTWKDALKMNYSSDANILANVKISERCLRQIEGVSIRGTKDLSKQKNVKLTRGTLSKTVVNGKNVSVLKILAPLKAGGGYGILTFVISEGCSVYSFSKDAITEQEFEKETLKNIGEAGSVAFVTFALVTCGSNPFGWAVLGAGIATASIYEFCYDYSQSVVISPEDFIKGFPEGVFDRNLISSFQPMDKRLKLLFDVNQNLADKDNNILHSGKNQNFIDSNNKNIIDY